MPNGSSHEEELDHRRPARSAGFSAVVRFYVIIMAEIGISQGAQEA